MEKVIIASQNPVKIEATQNGFKEMFPEKEFEFTGVHVNDGANPQPMTNEETLQGALFRVNNAKEQYPEADYWVGLEGGIEMKGEEMFSCVWIVILSKDLSGKSEAAKFQLPPEIAKLVQGGMELSHADDLVFNRVNSKHKDGATGILTHGVRTRAKYYTEAVIYALIPFKNRELFS